MSSAMFEKEMRHAAEFIPNRLYYVALSSAPPATSGRHFFSIDNEMVYWNFYLDFGPLNLGHVIRYCQLLNKKLNDPKLQDKVIVHYSNVSAPKRTNAAFLISAWALLCQNKSPEDAFKPFKNYVAPFPPWHDATPTTCTFTLTVLDTLKGLHKAREHKFFDFASFNIEEYEHYEQVENGDLNWYMDGKFLAFAGPHAERAMGPGGYYTHRPEDYVPYFKRKNVTLVVRLNKPYYDAKKFTQHGIDHMDLYFLDGSNPPDAVLAKFLARCEETPGAVAVHCKAGLGRTGTCVAAYMMKHFRLTAEEVIGWMRVARPGSVIGPQQHYLREIQNRMWREGELQKTRLTAQPSLLPAVDREKDSERARPGTSPSQRERHTLTTTQTTLTTVNSTTHTTVSSSQSALSSRPPSSASLRSPAGPAPSVSLSFSPSARPSSRGPSRPGTSSSSSHAHNAYTHSISDADRERSERDEHDKEATQGDLLRLRRQQHLQQSAVYSLSQTTATSSVSVSSPGGVANKVMSPSAADSPPRPRSRLGGLLSSWKN